MNYFKDAICTKLKQTYPELSITFSETPNVSMGHFSIPCFTYSRLLRRSPHDISLEFSALLESLDFIDHTEVAGGYLNCFIKTDILFDTIIDEVLTQKDAYGSSYEI